MAGGRLGVRAWLRGGAASVGGSEGWTFGGVGGEWEGSSTTTLVRPLRWKGDDGGRWCDDFDHEMAPGRADVPCRWLPTRPPPVNF